MQFLKKTLTEQISAIFIVPLWHGGYSHRTEISDKSYIFSNVAEALRAKFSDVNFPLCVTPCDTYQLIFDRDISWCVIEAQCTFPGLIFKGDCDLSVPLLKVSHINFLGKAAPFHKCFMQQITLCSSIARFIICTYETRYVCMCTTTLVWFLFFEALWPHVLYTSESSEVTVCCLHAFVWK